MPLFGLAINRNGPDPDTNQYFRKGHTLLALLLLQSRPTNFVPALGSEGWDASHRTFSSLCNRPVITQSQQPAARSASVSVRNKRQTRKSVSTFGPGAEQEMGNFSGVVRPSFCIFVGGKKMFDGWLLQRNCPPKRDSFFPSSEFLLFFRLFRMVAAA